MCWWCLAPQDITLQGSCSALPTVCTLNVCVLQVLEAVHGMLEVVNAYESAMETAAAQQGGQRGAAGGATTTSSNSGASSVEDIGPVLSAILEPLVEACERSAEALAPDAPSRVDDAGPLGGQARVDPSARSIYLINCLSSAATALTHHPCAGQRASALSDAAEGHVSALVGLEAGRILAKCGLADIVGRLRVYRSHLGPSTGDGRGAEEDAGGTDGSAAGSTSTQGGVPASDPALSHTRIVEGLRQFFIQISSPDALPEFPAIQVGGWAVQQGTGPAAVPTDHG
jgi:hypothetical protein